MKKSCTKQEGNNRGVESVWGKKKKGYSHKTLLAKAAGRSSGTKLAVKQILLINLIKLSTENVIKNLEKAISPLCICFAFYDCFST